MLTIKNATDTLTDVGALTVVGKKASKARGTKESLGDAREALGETIVTPGDAGVSSYSRRCRRTSYEAHDLRDDSRVAPRRFDGRFDVSSFPALVIYLSMYLAQRVILRHDFGCCERVSRDSPLQWKRRTD